MKYLLTLQSLFIQLRSERGREASGGAWLGCSAPREHLLLEPHGEQGGHLGHQPRPRGPGALSALVKLVTLRGPGTAAVNILQ